MPAKSKAQLRFLHAIASGYIKKPGLSSAKAAEYVAGQTGEGLPERKKRGLARLG